jgi:hypothetical protein
MKRSQLSYSTKQICSGVFMIAALLWLTISTPFVFRAQQEQKKEIQNQSTQNDNTNPFSNTTEEKNESSVNTLSEYLHDHPVIGNDFTVVKRPYQLYSSKIYFEHHPELLSPPPEA